MTSLSEVDFATIDEHLSIRRVRVFQLVQISLAGGIMIFLVMLLFFYGLGSDMDRGESSARTMDTFSMAVIVLSVTCIVVGQILYTSYFNRKRLERYANEPLRDRSRVIEDPAEKCLTIVQQATLTRAAIFNAPAFFGLLICMVGMMQGVIFVHPIYLLNGIPGLIQLGFLSLTFPTRDRILHLVQTKVLARNAN